MNLYLDIPWLALALHEIGTEEVAGPLHNQRILDYHTHTTLRAVTDEVPWCSAFVCWAMDNAHVESTQSAAARSWLDWGHPCPVRLGAVVVISRGGNTRPWQQGHEPQGPGHVGFWLGQNRSLMFLLGGNQSDRVKVSAYPIARMLGCRWPYPVD